VLGLGPLAIAPGDTGRVALALVAGESSAALLANADAAQSRFDQLWGSALAVAPGGAAAAAPLRLALAAGSPNPFGPRTALAYELPHRGPALLAVYNAAGRHVATLVDELVAAGPHVAAWEGRDGAGRPVASGVYYVRLQAAGEVRTQKLLKVR
jgi:hypothetical protein